MSAVAMTIRQARSENRTFWRNPASAFFTFVFPLMFIAIFSLVFGNDQIDVPGGRTNGATFFVPAIAAFSIITACYTNVAMTVTFARDQGILKRIRGTPLPSWTFLAGKIINAIVIGLSLVAIIIGYGMLFYDVKLPWHTLPAFAATLTIGAAAFCALGLAITGFVPNAEAAPAIVNGTIFPLLFISDVFIRSANAPEWLNTLAGIFPIRHFSQALQTAFNPFERGSGFEPGDLAVIAIWGAIGLVIASRKFTWEPRR
jgi:ABC-2 type transport system permease protein